MIAFLKKKFLGRIWKPCEHIHYTSFSSKLFPAWLVTARDINILLKKKQKTKHLMIHFHCQNNSWAD